MTKNDPSWGTVTKVHKIPGLAPITEYVVGPQWDDAGTTQYQIQTEGGFTCSYPSFDEALVAAICSKYDSHETAPFVWRLLRGKED